MASPWLPVLVLCTFMLLGCAAATGGNNISYLCYAGNETTVYDKELAQVALNLEYFEAEYYLWASYGYGLDVIAPSLAFGGPPPIGAQKANLTSYYTDIYKQLGLQEIGHIRCVSLSK